MAEPTEEEMRAQLEQELDRIRIGDLLLQTLYTLSSLTYRRISADDRDLAQARLGIEGLRALLAVLEETIPADAKRDFSQVIANLQLAYAGAVTAQQAAAEPEPEPESEPEPATEDEPDAAG